MIHSRLMPNKRFEPTPRARYADAVSTIARVKRNTLDRRLRGAGMPEQLSRQEQLRIVEYQEICSYHRHADATKWTAVGLTLAGALAAIAWSIVSAPYLTWAACLLAALFVEVGRRVFRQLQRFSTILLERARVIEPGLGMELHTFVRSRTRNPDESPATYPSGLGGQLIVGALIAAVFLAFVGVVAAFVTAGWVSMLAR